MKYTWAALIGLTFLAGNSISLRAADSGSVTLHVTDFGIEQVWDSQMKTGDVFYPQQRSVYNLNDPRSQILIPMPSDEAMKLSIEELTDEISSSLIQAVKARESAGISEFELQLVQHIDKAGYFDFLQRQDLVTKFGDAAYRAIDRLTEYLAAQHQTVGIDITVGSNGTAVFARNVDAWKPLKDTITHVDLVDGRALWMDVAKSISTIGESKVTVINTHGDFWAPPSSIGNYDVSAGMKAFFPGITSLLVRPRDGGDAHISWMTRRDAQFDVTETRIQFVSGALGGTRYSQIALGTFTPKTLSQNIRNMDTHIGTASGHASASVVRRSDTDLSTALEPKLGGIDFTTLRLSFVRAHSPAAVETVYSLPKGDPSDLAQLVGNTDLPGKAFRVAASMPASAFWVNLNPKEPDRITDSLLGKTDVARVLLEADLQLKRDAAAITDPRSSPVGREFWARTEAAAGARGGRANIVQGIRVWILPGQIVIAGDDDRAYVERAHMEVKLESQYLETREPASTRSENRQGALASTDAIARDLVLPLLNDWVNRAPQYEELRQVFVSLVLAQWYKDHHGILDARNLSAENWLRDQSWTPRATWLDYMRSLKNGEYNFSEVATSSQGDLIVTNTAQYFNGGVDFTELSLPSLRPLANDELETMTAVLSEPGPTTWHDRLWLANISVLGNTPKMPGSPTEETARDSSTYETAGVVLLILVGTLILVAVLSHKRPAFSGRK